MGVTLAFFCPPQTGDPLPGTDSSLTGSFTIATMAKFRLARSRNVTMKPKKSMKQRTYLAATPSGGEEQRRIRSGSGRGSSIDSSKYPGEKARGACAPERLIPRTHGAQPLQECNECRQRVERPPGMACAAIRGRTAGAGHRGASTVSHNGRMRCYLPQAIFQSSSGTLTLEDQQTCAKGLKSPKRNH